jgi:hypothetical protein
MFLFGCWSEWALEYGSWDRRKDVEGKKAKDVEFSHQKAKRQRKSRENIF